MSDYIPRNLRSLACKCFNGCKPDLPRFFPNRTSKYTVKEPCICPSDSPRCPTKNKIICIFCHKAHRLDVYRGTNFSTFSCLWCGNQTINTEEEIRAHLLECSHRPSPTVYTERNMCECEVCPYQCAKTLNMKDTYTQTLTPTRQEFLVDMDMKNPQNQALVKEMEPLLIVEAARKQETLANIEIQDRPEFERWNICRFGSPPNAEPNDRREEGWLEHYTQHYLPHQ